MKRMAVKTYSYIALIILVCTFLFTPIKAHAAVKSWIAPANSATFESLAEDGKDTASSEEEVKDASTKSMYRLIQNISYGIDEGTKAVTGSVVCLDLSNIILGKNYNGTVTFATFGLDEGNPFGKIAARLFVFTRGLALSLMFAYTLGLLVKQIFSNTAKGRAQLKEVAVNVIIVYALIYLMPVIVYYFIQLRDSLTAGAIGIMYGDYSESGATVLNGLLDGYQTDYLWKGTGITSALAWLALKFVPIIYIFSYIAIAISEMVMFIIYPFVAVLAVGGNKKLLSVWYGNFLAYLTVPFFDAVLVSTPMVIRKAIFPGDIGTGSHFMLLMVTLACMYSAQATRNALIKLLGGNMGVGTGPSPLAGMMRSAAMMARMKAMGGREGLRDGGGSANKEGAGISAVNKERDTSFGNAWRNETSKLSDLDQVENGNSATAETKASFSNALEDQVTGSTDVNGSADIDGTVTGAADATGVMDGTTGVPAESIETGTINGNEAEIDGTLVGGDSPSIDESNVQAENIESNTSNMAGGDAINNVANETNSVEGVGTESNVSASPMAEFEQARLENLEKMDQAAQAISVSEGAVASAKADLSDWQRIDSAQARISQLDTDITGYKARIADNDAKTAEIFGKYDTSPGGARLDNMRVEDRARIEALDKDTEHAQSRLDAAKSSRDMEYNNAVQSHNDIASKYGASREALETAEKQYRAGNHDAYAELGGPSNSSTARNSLQVAEENLKNNREILYRRQAAERNMAELHKEQMGGNGKVYESADVYKAKKDDNERLRAVANFRNYDHKAMDGVLTNAEKEHYMRQRQFVNTAKKGASAAASVAGVVLGGAAMAYGGADASMAGAQLGGMVGHGVGRKVSDGATNVVANEMERYNATIANAGKTARFHDTAVGYAKPLREQVERQRDYIDYVSGKKSPYVSRPELRDDIRPTTAEEINMREVLKDAEPFNKEAVKR